MPSPPSVSCTDLVLNVTLRCPLHCSHCCYRSEAKLSDAMCQSHMEQAIRDAASLGSVRTVHFNGGDPFLLPELMLSGIRLAHGFGMRTAAVTSAFFADTPDRATATLAPMAAAGLSEISVSYDDMHAVYITPRHLVNLVDAAEQLRLMVYVSVTIEPGSRIDRKHVAQLLGPGRDEARVRIYEVGINTTGRAADLADAASRTARAASAHAYRGPCNGVLRSIQVAGDGRILPCCGVLPHSDRMVIGHVDAPNGLAEALRRAAADPLWNAIASAGPVDLIVAATAGTDRALSAGEFDGICAACDRLFSDPRLLELARQRTIDLAG